MKIKRKRLVLLLSLVLLVAFIPRTAAQAREPGDLDDAARAAVVGKVAELLEAFYVFPDVGKKMGSILHEKLSAGVYRGCETASAFAGLLTTDLQEVSRDRHLRVTFDPATAAALLKGGPDSPDLQARRVLRERRENFGFEKLEKLAGNVGLLDLRFFADTAYAGETAAAAMRWLANSDAVIFDLRFNRGGSPRMVQLLCSYFFGPEPVHLNSLYWRPSDRTDEFWTLRELSGRRMPDVPLFILTSPRTFSGAEEFTYNLKHLERAVVVGGTTGGGAHPVNTRAVNREIVLSLPVGRAVNPVTGTNWEGTGVKPHIAVPPARASARAHLMALKALLERSSDESWNRMLRGWIDQIESDLARRR